MDGNTSAGGQCEYMSGNCLVPVDMGGGWWVYEFRGFGFRGFGHEDPTQFVLGDDRIGALSLTGVRGGTVGGWPTR